MSKQRAALVAAFLLLLTPVLAVAQSATSASVLGTVRDPSEAVVSGAEVKLENKAAGQTLTQTSNNQGQYIFPSVPPGTYTLTVKLQGFRTSTVQDLKLDVAKSYTLDFKLELGEVASMVMVEATAAVELQTTNPTVGTVIQGNVLPRLPAITRQVNDFLTLQPGTTPGGAVTGSRADQSAFKLEGIDITNNSVGGLGTYIPLPIDSVEEFRVAVANPDVTFGRGAGGQVSVVGRSGTNSYHGTTYWYHQNDNLNANTWENNRRGAKKPELKDNRFGFNFGGPVPFLWSDRTFFFLNYEGRRFPRSTSFTRTVPTSSLRQGILTFRDSANNVVSYNLATSTLCGTTGTLPCDPRGLGLSPTVDALWDMLPTGNSGAAGDGLNTTGYEGTVSNPLNNDFYYAKLDQNIGQKWHADVSFRYFRQKNINAGQLSIVGGQAEALRTFATRQNFLSAGLRGQFTSRFSVDFRFGWVRTRDATIVLTPHEAAEQLGISGTGAPNAPPTNFIALDLLQLSEPIDVGTQVARTQGNNNRNWQYNGDATWTVGTHTLQFGAHVLYLPTLHLRNDKVVGSLGSLVSQVGLTSVPSTARPPTCSATITTNCIRSTDVSRWDQLYSSTLGLVSSITILAVRDGQFNPLPFGSLLESDTKLWAPEFYVQDVWRLKPSLTLTLGLTYGYQTAPTEKLGRQTIQVDSASLEPITVRKFFAERLQAAQNGQIINPGFSFLPVKSAKRSVFDTDYNNVAPRVGMSWSPSFSGRLLGPLFGQRKTVVRGGVGIVFDRQNTVQSVIIPALGVGFAQTLNVTGPLCNVTGPGGAVCTPAGTSPASGFRVGVDGTMPVPAFGAQSIPVTPFWGIVPGSPGPPFASSALRTFPEVLSFQLDPKMEVGKNYVVDLTWQRELPWNMIFEIGYAGRFGRKLPQSMSLSNSPYMFKDTVSGQTFAEAFDAVAAQIRAGTSAANVTPQPWFANMIPAASCTAFANCTVWVASNNVSGFNVGNVGDIFLAIDRARMLNGLQPFNNSFSNVAFLRSSVGRSNYNALFFTVNKRPSRGVQFTVNYTYSRSLDQLGAIQNAAGFMPNSFDLDAEYGPSPFDITHLFNARGVFDLPFRSSNAFLGRVIGGWYVSGIFTALSGQPLTVTQGQQVWGSAPDPIGLGLGFATGAIPTINPLKLGNSVHGGVAGSGGVGTTGNPATCTPLCGTGLNMFANPEVVANSFRRVRLSADGRSGRANPLRGLPHWSLDFSVGKKTHVTEKVNAVFSVDFFNLFNNPQFNDPSLSLNNLAAFGVLSSQWVPTNRADTGAGSRWIQIGVRVEF